MALSDTVPPPLTAFADPLQALRQATAATHAMLDARLAIAQPTATLMDYAAHARGLAAWLQALSPPLAALQADMPHFEFMPAHRLAHLQQDLQDIAAPAPACWPAPSTPTRLRAEAALQKARGAGQARAARWGMGYVVEGSQLGGLVLHARLAGALAPHPLRYLRGSAGDTAGRWKCFVGQLRDHLNHSAAVAAACDGAQAAFDGLVDEFTGTGGLLP
ncbi:biliverdin-producing heme oxygenase [Paracidovorax sp. MALMAid1276]|uniref:biliverdin-producing heme oxygenase n=1 Tax=Paracidovorax sp. MALMAid1276 TaxID=3411631 RepID=UPI003B9AD423